MKGRERGKTVRVRDEGKDRRDKGRWVGSGGWNCSRKTEREDSEGREVGKEEREGGEREEEEDKEKEKGREEW